MSKRKNLAIQINSWSDLTKENLTQIIENILGFDCTLSSIKSIKSQNTEWIEYSKLLQKKNEKYRNQLVFDGFVEIEITYIDW